MGDDIKQLEATWDKLAKEFRNWNGVRPKKTWFKTGLSERVGYNRLRILEGSSQAKTYFSLIKDLSGRELNYLQARAIVNLEQAQAAARLATIFNLTVYIAAIMIFNQLFPGEIAKFIQTMLQGGDTRMGALSIVVIVLFSIQVIGLLSYSHGGAAQARDLKHLLELSLARREFHGGKRHHSETDTEPTDILRENFITDI